MAGFLDVTDGTPINDPSLGTDPLTGDLIPSDTASNLGIDPLTGELDAASAISNQSSSINPINSSSSTSSAPSTSVWDNILGMGRIAGNITTAVIARNTSNYSTTGTLASQQRQAQAPRTGGTSIGLVVIVIILFLAFFFIGDKFTE